MTPHAIQKNDTGQRKKLRSIVQDIVRKLWQYAAGSFLFGSVCCAQTLGVCTSGFSTDGAKQASIACRDDGFASDVHLEWFEGGVKADMQKTEFGHERVSQGSDFAGPGALAKKSKKLKKPKPLPQTTVC